MYAWFTETWENYVWPYGFILFWACCILWAIFSKDTGEEKTPVEETKEQDTEDEIEADAEVEIKADAEVEIKADAEVEIKADAEVDELERLRAIKQELIANAEELGITASAALD